MSDFSFLLENYFQTNLIVPWWPSGLDLSKVPAAAVVRHRIAQCRRVGEVKRLQAKLRDDSLGDLKRFVRREVQIEQAWSAQNISSRIAKRVWSIRRKRGSVEPFLHGRAR